MPHLIHWNLFYRFKITVNFNLVSNVPRFCIGLIRILLSCLSALCSSTGEGHKTVCVSRDSLHAENQHQCTVTRAVTS